ncbi:helix-turn-helix domain-containing protein, partial [Actinoplanes philippinensis]|uniref:helix-turn-helix domain-containing protein n=1 Tax=Actinoplanes philippinensis TaxID=35752 RepID=UPI003403A5E2
MLDVTRLTVLAAVAKHGSVTAAARALHYAQPSVSHHLARLEAETGSRLLQRVGQHDVRPGGPDPLDPPEAGRRRGPPHEA